MIRTEAAVLMDAANLMADGKDVSKQAVINLLRAIADRWEITPSGVILSALEAASTVGVTSVVPGGVTGD